MKPPSGSTSSLTMVAISDGAAARNCGSGKRSSDVDQLVAHAAQHALAEPALEGGDVELEVAVHEHEEQEQQAEIDEHRDAAELEAAEEHDLAAAEQPAGQVEGDPHRRFGVARAGRIPGPGSGR